MKVILKGNAKKSIWRITYYIAKQGFPENAVKFAERLEEFAESLALMPDKFPICKQKSYAKRKFILFKPTRLNLQITLQNYI